MYRCPRCGSIYFVIINANTERCKDCSREFVF